MIKSMIKCTIEKVSEKLANINGELLKAAEREPKTSSDPYNLIRVMPA